jgi:hypothetical protein
MGLYLDWIIPLMGQGTKKRPGTSAASVWVGPSPDPKRFSDPFVLTYWKLANTDHVLDELEEVHTRC